MASNDTEEDHVQENDVETSTAFKTWRLSLDPTLQPSPPQHPAPLQLTTPDSTLPPPPRQHPGPPHHITPEQQLHKTDDHKQQDSVKTCWCGDTNRVKKRCGGISCWSCYKFFKRHVRKQSNHRMGWSRTCGKGNCNIYSKTKRRRCSPCRYEKCLEYGMKPSKVKPKINKEWKVELNQDSDTEHPQGSNPETLNGSDKEQSHGSNNTSLLVSNTEPQQGSNTEHMQGSNTEPQQGANTEPMQVSNTEPMQVSNTEQMQGSNTEHMQ